MSDVVSFTEIDGQQVDLLPARTLLQSSGGGSESSLGPAGDLLGSLTGGGDDSNSGGGGDLLGGVTNDLGGLTGGGA